MPLFKPLLWKPDVACKEELKNFPETFKSVSKMIDIQNKLININGIIDISLEKCSILSPASIMLLASISVIRNNLKQNTILSFGENIKILEQLIEINFIQGKKTKKFNTEIKPFKTETEAQKICNEIRSSSKFANIDKDERNIIISKTYELLINSYEHGKNNIGAISHSFYRNKKFHFSIYDFGIGIPETVRNYTKDSTMSDIDCIQWALHDGNSTKLTSDSEFPGGSGLKLIEKFLGDYNGKLIICSGKAYYLIKGQQIIAREFSNNISGTLITLAVPI